jgi:hypothetical protein
MPLHKHANPQNKRGRKEVEKKIQNLRREEAVDEGEEDEEDLLNLVIPERPGI